MNGIGQEPGTAEAQEDGRRMTLGAVGLAVGGVARRAGRILLDGLMPPVCLGCGCRIDMPGALCASCWQDVRFIEAPMCPVYGTPFSAPLGAGVMSARAIADPPPYARARAAVVYDGLARRLVHRHKFADRQDQSRFMAQWMVRAGTELLAEADVVVAVPLHWRRFMSRRFNQSAELARHIAAERNLVFRPQALERHKATRRQLGLNATERDSNVRGAFRVPDGERPMIEGRHIVVVDDVITTGATVAACSRALLRAGAASVDVLAFAYALKGDEALARASTQAAPFSPDGASHI